MEADLFRYFLRLAAYISTHSLTRRLTSEVVLELCPRMVISTHSLTRRLTFFLCVYFQHIVNFNSQPHKEADVAITCLWNI